ncbi:MAG: hypothetical protein DRJ57_00960 [Thermoprotei archaeon]|nr:MAG: hypothetical protein DRJ57_00960 [Thermoprotei archaeon]
MLRGVRTLEAVHSTLTRAMLLYLINSLVPPLLLLLASRHGWAYTILWPAVVYEVVCIVSLLAIYMARSAVSDYSLPSARRLMLLAGILGLFTALIAGGLLTLNARKRLDTIARGGKARKKTKV